LRSLRTANGQLTSLDIAQRAKIPKSSGRRIVATREKIAILSRGPRGRYQPGISLASLAADGALRVGFFKYPPASSM